MGKIVPFPEVAILGLAVKFKDLPEADKEKLLQAWKEVHDTGDELRVKLSSGKTVKVRGRKISEQKPEDP